MYPMHEDLSSESDESGENEESREEDDSEGSESSEDVVPEEGIAPWNEPVETLVAYIDCAAIDFQTAQTASEFKEKVMRPMCHRCYEEAASLPGGDLQMVSNSLSPVLREFIRRWPHQLASLVIALFENVNPSARKRVPRTTVAKDTDELVADVVQDALQSRRREK